jgi:hypothetical protein
LVLQALGVLWFFTASRMIKRRGNQ